MIVLGLILLRSPFGLLMLAVLIPPTRWLAGAVTLAVVAVVAWHEKRASSRVAKTEWSSLRWYKHPVPCVLEQLWYPVRRAAESRDLFFVPWHLVIDQSAEDREIDIVLR